MRSSPWKIEEVLLQGVCQDRPEDDISARVSRAVMAALNEACGPCDRSVDVLQGVAEALCLLYVLLIDPARCASMEEAKPAFLSAMGLAYDMIVEVRAKNA